MNMTLEGENKRLRARIRELDAENARLQVQFDMVACTNIELQTENARLREALERYGKHDRSCFYRESWWEGRWPIEPTQQVCTCGLGAALANGERSEQVKP